MVLPLVPAVPSASLSTINTITTGYTTSSDMAISGDGSTVVFYTDDVLSGDDTNGKNDVYVYNVALETYERVSLHSNGSESTDGNSFYGSFDLSYDGNYVVFSSNVSDLIDNDTNGYYDTFIHDRSTGSTERISVDSAENEIDASAYNGSTSDNGRYVVFESIATNVVAGDTNATRDVFLRDRVAGTTERVSLSSSGAELTGGYSIAENKSISGDGRYVLFTSYATNTIAGDVNGDSGVFIRDTVADTTTRVSVDENGDELLGASVAGTITNNGEYVVFKTASQAVAEDTQTYRDVYVHKLSDGTNTLASSSAEGVVGDQHSQLIHNDMYVSEDGRFVLFYSNATNLIDGYTPPFGPYTLYHKDLVSGNVEMINDEFNHQISGMSADGTRILYRNGDGDVLLAIPSNTQPVVPTNTQLEGGGTETADTTPAFIGDCATGDVITLYIDGISSDVSEVCNSFSVTAPELTPGEYDISFTATRLGIESAQSSVLGISISNDYGSSENEPILVEAGMPYFIQLTIGIFLISFVVLLSKYTQTIKQ